MCGVRGGCYEPGFFPNWFPWEQHKYLLKNDPSYITKATTTALAVVALESTGTFDALRSGMNLGIARDLVADQQRESVRFFAKRNNCNCLKNMHQYLKAKPKYGVCASCATSKERKKLLMCDGCKVAQVRDAYAAVLFRFYIHILAHINVVIFPLFLSTAVRNVRSLIGPYTKMFAGRYRAILFRKPYFSRCL